MYTAVADGAFAISIVFPVLAAIFVMLRFIARKIKSISFQADDWIVLSALVGA